MVARQCGTMPGSARRYDLYLPLTYNDGRPIPENVFGAVHRRLLDRFGGLTAQQREFPLQGIWQGATRLYLDQVIIMTALDFRRHPRGRPARLAVGRQLSGRTRHACETPRPFAV
jgi:hypothetical protein